MRVRPRSEERLPTKLRGRAGKRAGPGLLDGLSLVLHYWVAREGRLGRIHSVMFVSLHTHHQSHQ